jgi:O-antigen/teichoic acid export membrane protein
LSQSNDLKDSFSGKIIARNSIFNLLGYGIPILSALFIFPPLIKGLGQERFGILNIVWMMIGYFSFFDFGIGRSLTKITAEKIGLNQHQDIPPIFWTSILLMFIVSIAGGILISFFIPNIIKYFNISPNLQNETLQTFYALIISIPVVSTSAGLRGVLEAYQKFPVINVIRIILGILTFLGPLIFLILTNSLFWIVVFLLLIRIVIWFIYFIICFRVNSSIKSNVSFKFSSIKPLLHFSIWITIANIVGPLILYSDRFLIGVLLSASAITFYATPYEIVTKLLMIPSSLMGVLFPAFSASYYSDPELSRDLFYRGLKFVFFVLFPFILLIIYFAYEGMNLWLGEEFARNSSFILRILAIGVFVNSLALVPDNYFQGAGKPKISTMIYLIEMPLFIALMWAMVKIWGINGAAITWTSGAILSSAANFYMAKKVFGLSYTSKYKIPIFLLILIVLLIPFVINNVLIKLFFLLIFFPVSFYFTWKYIFSENEKRFIKTLVPGKK